MAQRLRETSQRLDDARLSSGLRKTGKRWNAEFIEDEGVETLDALNVVLVPFETTYGTC